MLFAGSSGPNGFEPDWFAVQATSTMLIVQHVKARTVSGYALPVSRGERPAFVIANLNPQGLAVDGRGEHLFVSRGRAVYDYRLPYVSGEKPLVLQVDGRFLPLGNVGSLAASANHLYVRAWLNILSYTLPLRGHESPDAVVSIRGVTNIFAGN